MCRFFLGWRATFPLSWPNSRKFPFSIFRISFTTQIDRCGSVSFSQNSIYFIAHILSLFRRNGNRYSGTDFPYDNNMILVDLMNIKRYHPPFPFHHICICHHNIDYCDKSKSYLFLLPNKEIKRWKNQSDIRTVTQLKW